MTQGHQRFRLDAAWDTRVSHRKDDRNRSLAIAASVDPSSESVLEVGCGDGSNLEMIGPGPGGRRLRVGMDLHPAALAAVRRALGEDVGIAAGSATHLPFSDRTFSTVICAEVLEHLPEPMLRLACSELARVARNRVIVTVPNRERLVRRRLPCPSCGHEFHAYGHLQSFQTDMLRSLLPGFRAVRIRELGPRRDESLALLDDPWRRTRLPDEHIACPECGWSGTGAEAGIARGGRGTRFGARAAMRLFGGIGRRRWLMAVYEPE